MPASRAIKIIVEDICGLGDAFDSGWIYKTEGAIQHSMTAEETNNQPLVLYEEIRAVIVRFLNKHRHEWDTIEVEVIDDDDCGQLIKDLKKLYKL